MDEKDVTQDATVTVNWFRVNVPTIVAVGTVFFAIAMQYAYISYKLEDIERARSVQSTASDAAFREINAKLNRFENIPYRMDRAEENVQRVDTKIDTLSNTLIQNVDLLRRDINRLTTQVEVLSSRVGMLTGDEDIPRRRISRPAANQ